MMQAIHVKLNPGLSCYKQHSRGRTVFSAENFRKKQVKCFIWSTLPVYGAEIGKQIRNIWEVLMCGAGEGWRRSFGPIVSEMRKYSTESNRTGIFYVK
jgi:hypothetical protein